MGDMRNDDRSYGPAGGTMLARDIMGSGADKTVLLYEAVNRVWGRHLDPGPQGSFECVGWAYAGCVDLLACINICLGESEYHSWELRTSTEAVYGMSRVDYGNLKGSKTHGSIGAWGARAVQEGGTLSRRRVREADGGGEHDFQRARRWGFDGLPEALKSEARKHRVRSVSLVQTFEEARDAIANGYPVAVGSDQTLSFKRDAQGFATPSSEKTFHCMKFIGCCDGSRPGLLCMDSRGRIHTGPLGKWQIPEGSFWVDAAVCTAMLAQRDSFALGQFEGYKSEVFAPRIDRLGSLRVE